MAGQGNQFYSDEEAEEILRLAIGKTSQVGAVSRQNLEQSAAELGISPEALAEAELQVIERRSEVQDRQEFRQLQKSDYVASLWQSLTTIGVLFAINYFTLHQLSWSLIVALFLGLKLVLEGTSHLVPMSASYQEEFSK